MPDIATSALTRQRLFGLDFVSASSIEAVADDIVERTLAGGPGALVVTPNVDHLVQYDRTPRLAALAATAEYLLPDGAPIVWASRLLRRPLAARLTGSDLFVPMWLRWKADDVPVVVVASNENTAAKLAADHRRAHTFVAPFYADDDAAARRAVVETILDAVETTGARFVILGLPLPKHHDLARDLRGAAAAGRAAPTLLLIGSAAEFYIGTKARAPRIFQRLGLEWLHRLASEPRRLAKRYLVDDSRFALLFVRELRSKGAAARG